MKTNTINIGHDKVWHALRTALRMRSYGYRVRITANADHTLNLAIFYDVDTLGEVLEHLLYKG